MARSQRIDTARRLGRGGASPLRSVFVALVLALVAVASPPSASAQSEEAQRLFREGVALREAGDSAGAISRLRAAHRLEPDDLRAYNLAAALADAGRLVEARTLLRRIVARPSELLIADAATALLAQITPRIASVSLTIDGDASDTRLLVDGARTDRGPGGARAVSLDPGRHRFEVHDRRGNVLARSEIEVGEGERRALVLRPVTSPLATAHAATPDAGAVPVGGTPAGDDTWLWVGVGVGAAVAIGVAIVIAAVMLGGPSAPAVNGDLPAVVVRGRDR